MKQLLSVGTVDLSVSNGSMKHNVWPVKTLKVSMDLPLLTQIESN